MKAKTNSLPKKLLKKVINGNLSFTLIGCGLTITATYVLKSVDVLDPPSLIAWSGIIITGGAIGLVLDCLQSYFSKFI